VDAQVPVNGVTINLTPSTNMDGKTTSRELTRNRRVGQRERGPHESFSLVSPYSQYPSLGEILPPIMGKGIPVPGRQSNSEPALLSVGG